MKWSKRLKSLTKKGEFNPHPLSISGRSLKEILSASWHWQVGINPLTGFCHKPYEVAAEPQSRTPHLLRAGLHLFTQAHHRVSKIQQKTCPLGEQRTRAPNILTLS